MSTQLTRATNAEKDDEIKNFLIGAEVRAAPSIRWDDVVGIREACDKMKEHVILPVMYPQLCSGTKRHGLLLYGPPGTGKTLLVQAVIAVLLTNCSNALCYKLSAYDLFSRLLKSPIRVFQAMMEEANSHENTVVFIDDVDALCEQTTGTGLDVIKEMYTQINNSQSNRLCFVGISNKPWKLREQYLLRRTFSRRISIPLPDCVERSAIFKKELKSFTHTLSEDDFRKFGEMSEGLTGSDICIVARDSGMQPIRKMRSATHFKRVCEPSADDPNKMRDDLLTPCEGDDPEAVEMDWTEIDLNMLASPIVTVDDVMKSLSMQKPSVSQEEVAMYDIPFLS